ncbi:MAG: metal-dependent hydrolase [Clostridium sp.]
MYLFTYSYIMYLTIFLFKEQLMTKETHTSGGFFIALLALNSFTAKYISNYDLYYKIFLIIIYFYSANLGSLFPDIDMKSSFISKRHPFIAKHFGKRLRHRGITHSLIFLFTLFLLFKVLISISSFNIVVITISYGFLFGYTSHLLLDLLTKEGIELFFPLKTNIKIFFIKTGSKGEKIFYNFLKGITFLLIVYNIYLILNNQFHFDILIFLKFDKILH